MRRSRDQGVDGDADRPSATQTRRSRSDTQTRRRKEQPADAKATTGGANATPHKLDVALSVVTALTAFAVPLFISATGEDVFRLPKALALVFGGIIALAIILVGLTFGVWKWSDLARHPLPFVVTAALIAWWITTAATSSYPQISARVLPVVLAGGVLFVATTLASQGRGLVRVYPVVLAAAINAAIVLMQAANIWNPFSFGPQVLPDLRVTGLVGNPDDAGSFLTVGFMVALALALRTRTRLSWHWLALTVLFAAGIFATGARGAVLAAAAGGCALVVIRRRRMLTTVLAGVVILALAGSLAWQPARERLRRYVTNPAQVSSGRLIPFLAAVRMARTHPLVGIGPGCFGIEFFEQKPLIEASYPSYALVGHQMYFRETHNDHLQIAAETGLTGYALFLLALAALAWRRQRLVLPPVEFEDDTREFAGLLSLPLAVALVTLTLTQFPLQIAAPASSFIYVAALCIAWRGEA